MHKKINYFKKKISWQWKKVKEIGEKFFFGDESIKWGENFCVNWF